MLTYYYKTFKYYYLTFKNYYNEIEEFIFDDNEKKDDFEKHKYKKYYYKNGIVISSTKNTISYKLKFDEIDSCKKYVLCFLTPKILVENKIFCLYCKKLYQEDFTQEELSRKNL